MKLQSDADAAGAICCDCCSAIKHLLVVQLARSHRTKDRMFHALLTIGNFCSTCAASRTL